MQCRGIDAPENSMPYGKEAKEELVKLVQGRTLKISVYDTDWYGRLVGDVECNGVFVQVQTHTFLFEFRSLIIITLDCPY
jgi:endonuclease YncB( thermonuclease family)